MTLLADDPAAAADVAAWCRMRGQRFEGSSPADRSDPTREAVAYRIRILSA